MVTLCTLHAATILSQNCRADFGRPFTKKGMSHFNDLRDDPGVTAPLPTSIVPLTGMWDPPTSVTPPLKLPDKIAGSSQTSCRTHSLLRPQHRGQAILEMSEFKYISSYEMPELITKPIGCLLMQDFLVV